MRLPNIEKVCHTIRDTINDVLDTFPENGVFVELGTYLGNTAGFIIASLVLENKKFTFYNVDNFGYHNIPDNQKIIDNNPTGYDSYLSNIKRLGIQDYTNTIIGNTLEVAGMFADKSIFCLFIDDDHGYDHVKKELEIWTPKMAIPGIIIGDDYADPGVKRAYDEFFGTKVIPTPRGGCIIHVG